MIKNLKPFRIMIGLVIFLILLQTLADLLLPTLMANIVDIGIVNGDIKYIWKIGGLMLLIASFGVISSIMASYFSARVALSFGKDLREQLFTKVTNFSLQQFNEIGTASLITRTTNDITQLQQILVVMLRMVIMAPMMSIGGIIMAVSRDTKLSIIFLIVIPFLAIAIFTIVRKGMPLFKALQKKLDKLNLIVRENLTGIRVIRAFNRVDYEKDRFDNANVKLTKIAIKVNRLMSLMMPIMMITLNFSIVAIVWFGSIRIDHGHMQVGQLMSFIQYAMLIMFSLMMMSMMFVLIPRASVSAERINEVLLLDEQTDEANLKRLERDTRHQSAVQFNDVTFSYPGAEKPALSNISFNIKQGEVAAIIGGTGAGKTTLINLILKFYEVDKGHIFVNGVNINSLQSEQLRSQIGFVPQNSVVFTGTIADNIRFGNEGATDEQILRAAEIAQASDFINELENRYETNISQGGTNLSGGQRQRLSIARALVREPEIYIFDDSFSALDYKTDAKLRKELAAETAGATVIIVAQRVSTVLDADRILVLHGGEIVGNDTHSQLIKSNQIYREIVSSQLGEEGLNEYK